MSIKVRNIPKEERKGTTKLETLPEFCITMYGAERALLFQGYMEDLG